MSTMPTKVTLYLNCPDCGLEDEIRVRPGLAEGDASIPCERCGKMIVPEIRDEPDVA